MTSQTYRTHLVDKAFAFLRPYADAGQLCGIDLDRHLQGCAAHLTSTAGASTATADEATLLAWSELASRGRREFIDCSRSTSHTLFISDAQGKRHAFTLHDLVDRLGLDHKQTH